MSYHFTQEQLSSLLYATIDMYLEFRDVHEHAAEASRFESVDEMFQGLDADRELAQHDPTERLRLQLPDLLDALKEIEAHHVEQNRIKGREENRSTTLRIARAAIAKACAL